MKAVFRIAVSWPNAVRESGAPEFSTYPEAEAWIQAHDDGMSVIEFEIRKVWTNR